MFDLEFKRLGANKLVTICGADRYQNHNIGVQLRWKCIMCRLFPHVSYYRYSGQETNDQRHVSVKNCTCFFARIQAQIWLRIKCRLIPHVQSPWTAGGRTLLKIFNKNSGQMWLCISNSHTCGQRKQQTGHSINRIPWPWPNGYYLLLPVFLAHFCLNLPTNFRSINIPTFKACFRLVLLGRPRMSASKQLIIGAINQYLCFL